MSREVPVIRILSITRSDIAPTQHPQDTVVDWKSRNSSRLPYTELWWVPSLLFSTVVVSHTMSLPLLVPTSTFRPRTAVDIRVGKFHVIQLLIHLRHRDWTWYQENAEDITEECLELLQEKVLPRMVGDELEAYYHAKHPGVLPPLEEELGSKVGSKNKKGSKKQQGKGKKGGVSAAAAAASTKKRKGKAQGEDDEKEKPEKDVYFSFGDTIQLSYRREPALPYKTIFFKNQLREDDTVAKSKKLFSSNNSRFRDYLRLSHRLLIWISKADSDQKTNPDPKDVGFYRPEMIPISSLFRQPADLELEDDDED